MTQELSSEVRTRLSDHLDAVEKVLIDAGRTREQRRAVVDDLESQILEMLAARTAKPVLADVEAVLNEIDPPSAYAEPGPDGNTQAAVTSAPAGSSRPARLSKVAWGGFMCVVASLAIVLLQAITWSMMRPEMKSDGGVHDDFMFWAILAKLSAVAGMGVGLVGAILGWIGFVQIRGSKGDLRGSGWALLAGLFYPTILIVVLLLLVIRKLL